MIFMSFAQLTERINCSEQKLVSELDLKLYQGRRVSVLLGSTEELSIIIIIGGIKAFKVLKMVDQVSEIIKNALFEGRTALLEPEANRVCGLYGVPVTNFKLAETEREAVKFSREIGYPVVLKIVSPDILHKSDAGGVIVNLKTPEEVGGAYRRIIDNAKQYKPDAKIVGLIVQEMAPSSTEVIIGMTKDPTFGPALMFGLGGIFVEVLGDVSFRIAPITERDAVEMIREIRAYKILEGVRGREPADKDAIVDILLKVSKLVTEHEEIDQLDLNPIFVYSRGAKAVDTRILISPEAKPKHG